VKFYQLQPGARFRYRATVFRKVSPLKATSEADATQRLIPRSAEVTLLDESGDAVPERLPDTLPGARVEAALEQFLTACARATERTDPPLTDAQRAQLAQAFNAAGHDMLTRLALAD
jgi:hypothetical protein